MSQNCLRIVSELSQNSPRTVPELSQNCNRILTEYNLNVKSFVDAPVYDFFATILQAKEIVVGVIEVVGLQFDLHESF